VLWTLELCWYRARKLIWRWGKWQINKRYIWTLIQLFRDGFEKIQNFDEQFFRSFGRRTYYLYDRDDGWSPIEDGFYLYDRQVAKVRLENSQWPIFCRTSEIWLEDLMDIQTNVGVAFWNSRNRSKWPLSFFTKNHTLMLQHWIK